MSSGNAFPLLERVLAVVVHPDDESFGLGALLDTLVRGGAGISDALHPRRSIDAARQTRRTRRRPRRRTGRRGEGSWYHRQTSLNRPDSGPAIDP